MIVLSRWRLPAKAGRGKDWHAANGEWWQCASTPAVVGRALAANFGRARSPDSAWSSIPHAATSWGMAGLQIPILKRSIRAA